MQTRFSRRPLRRSREEPITEQRREWFEEESTEPQTANQSQQATANDVIADIAKSFMQLQAKASKDAPADTNQEVVGMLEKLNRQLEHLQQAVESKDRSSDEGQKETGSQKPEELCNLFSQYLRDNKQEKDSGTNSQLLGGQGSSDTKGQSSGNGAVNAQTAQELLSKTQYELANELEASLKKLKQVIQESEKVAARISNLLDEKKK